MVTAEVAARQVVDLADDPAPREILGFFERHSRTRFDRLAVRLALSADGRRAFPDKAFRGLVEQGRVKECVENGVPYYSLNLPPA